MKKGKGLRGEMLEEFTPELYLEGWTGQVQEAGLQWAGRGSAAGKDTGGGKSMADWEPGKAQ